MPEQPEDADFLSTDGILYCSMDCLRHDGSEFDRVIESDEYSEAIWGVFCPVCSRTFHCIEEE